MKDDIHNTVLVDSSADRAVLVSLGDVEKALQNVKGTKVNLFSLAAKLPGKMFIYRGVEFRVASLFSVQVSTLYPN